jgi:hypothetical protein
MQDAGTREGASRSEGVPSRPKKKRQQDACIARRGSGAQMQTRYAHSPPTQRWLARDAQGERERRD